MNGSTPRVILLAAVAPIERADLAGLCVLLERSSAEVAFCDVGGMDADAATVEALARLQLVARRHGCRVRLRNASTELRELVAFMGLHDVLPE